MPQQLTREELDFEVRALYAGLVMSEAECLGHNATRGLAPALDPGPHVGSSRSDVPLIRDHQAASMPRACQLDFGPFQALEEDSIARSHHDHYESMDYLRSLPRRLTETELRVQSLERRDSLRLLYYYSRSLLTRPHSATSEGDSTSPGRHHTSPPWSPLVTPEWATAESGSAQHPSSFTDSKHSHADVKQSGQTIQFDGSQEGFVTQNKTLSFQSTLAYLLVVLILTSWIGDHPLTARSLSPFDLSFTQPELNPLHQFVQHRPPALYDVRSEDTAPPVAYESVTGDAYPIEDLLQRYPGVATWEPVDHSATPEGLRVTAAYGHMDNTRSSEERDWQAVAPLWYQLVAERHTAVLSHDLRQDIPRKQDLQLRKRRMLDRRNRRRAAMTPLECVYCLRPFSRADNRLRHYRKGCKMIDAKSRLHYLSSSLAIQGINQQCWSSRSEASPGLITPGYGPEASVSFATEAWQGELDTQPEAAPEDMSQGRFDDAMDIDWSLIDVPVELGAATDLTVPEVDLIDSIPSWAPEPNMLDYPDRAYWPQLMASASEIGIEEELYVEPNPGSEGDES